MKYTYPIIMYRGEKNIIVDVPDFGISTQGATYEKAILMAEDAIELTGYDMICDKEELPAPSSVESIREQYPESEYDLKFIEVDFDEYSRVSKFVDKKLLPIVGKALSTLKKILYIIITVIFILLILIIVMKFSEWIYNLVMNSNLPDWLKYFILK